MIKHKRHMLTSGIKPPKFKVGRFVLNEYELREMIALIAEGELSCEGISIKDEKGNVASINESGVCSINLHGFGLATSFTLRKLKAITKK